MVPEVTVDAEIADVSRKEPHLVLLGAGASRAALPGGDRNGRPVPLLAEVADQLGLKVLFPADLQALAATDFEAAYSRLHDRDPDALAEINDLVRTYFQQLQLPDHATLYDLLILCLRPKDSVFTFTWDPFLLQAYNRIADAGVQELPRLHFLHGNVDVGYCAVDSRPGLLDVPCTVCGQQLTPTPLMYPVEHKNYQDGGFLELEWTRMRECLEVTYFLTVFGYSAPRTDVEAIELLQKGWGPTERREMEQTEIISRPGADEEALRATWAPFIHTHHYEVHRAYRESWLALHPRRSIEGYWNQYVLAQFINNNPVPDVGGSIEDLVAWFEPLLEVERAAAVP
jgi:hypothetical protein